MSYIQKSHHYYSLRSTSELRSTIQVQKWSIISLVIIILLSIAMKLIFFTNLTLFSYLSDIVWLPFVGFFYLHYNLIRDILASRGETVI